MVNSEKKTICGIARRGDKRSFLTMFPAYIYRDGTAGGAFNTEKISGIYKITNTRNGKFYIGSSNNIADRWNKHKNQLRTNKHHSILLQRAWNKYGEPFFTFDVLERVPQEKLLEVEQQYLDQFKPYINKNGYNVSDKATCVSVKRGPMSEETKEKIRQARMGHEVSEETRKKISQNHANLSGENAPFYGRHHSEENKKAHSELMTGRYLGEKSPRAVITFEVAHRAKELYGRHTYTQNEIASMLQIPRGTLTNIIYGKCWKEA